MEELYKDGVAPVAFERQIGNVLVVECNNPTDPAVQRTYKCYCLVKGWWNLSLQYKTLKAGENAKNWSGRTWRSERLIVVPGQKFGLLTAIRQVVTPRKSNLHTKSWEFECTCGQIIVRQPGSINNNSHCGCRSVNSRRVDPGLQRRHGNMIQRCHNSRNSSYKDYGARGITVCDEWRDYFVFEKWAIENGYDPKLTIDRIDNNLGYSPDNCRWVTQKEQTRNRRSNHIVDFDKNGRPICRREFAKNLERITGVPYRTIESRLKAGCSTEEAINLDSRNHEAFGEAKTLGKWAEDRRCCVSLQTLRSRVYRGWSMEEALTKPPRKGARLKVVS